MSMGRRPWIALLCAAVALVVCLVGCSGGAVSPTSGASGFLGTWSVTSVTSDGKALSDDELAVTKAMGIYITLEEGGKATFEMFGKTVDGKWEESGANKATLTLGDDGNDETPTTQDMTLADDKLTMAFDSDEMVFERIDPSEKQEFDLGSLADESTGDQSGEAEQSDAA